MDDKCAYAFAFLHSPVQHADTNFVISIANHLALRANPGCFVMINCFQCLSIIKTHKNLSLGTFVIQRCQCTLAMNQLLWIGPKLLNTFACFDGFSTSNSL